MSDTTCICSTTCCQPLREAVSWNSIKSCACKFPICQPLREAVSWNLGPTLSFCPLVVSLFVRLWVEMKQTWTPDQLLLVSLFVRLWVEISKQLCKLYWNNVSLFVRLWVEIFSLSHIIQNIFVSLFVRLWVEILMFGYSAPAHVSASSWGCELKYPSAVCGQPGDSVSLFVRLWVEICSSYLSEDLPCCQPLREAVSWNVFWW